MSKVEWLTGWQQDDCYDPIHREALVRVDGRVWRLHDAMPGYGGFSAYHYPYDGHMVMVDRVEDLLKA
ncbi:hypothetical protein ACN20G_29780 (plasmid) [Streptomyces sp. BI20]|uniref:hypothetical protein n=1 Tax=Streptomyces sp. BI20 TaxID=3403460 RepID=UPI003C746A98